MSNGEVFSAFANGLPAASAVTANTRLAGIENTGPTAQQYAPTTTGAASSLVATNPLGEITATHFIGTGTPTVAAGPGSGATTPATISITGTDASMQVSFTTNQAGINAGVMFTVTFATPFAVAPTPTFSPASPATANDLIIHEFWISATTTTLTMTAGAGTFGNGITVTLNIKT